jgi:hypothetical protein
MQYKSITASARSDCWPGTCRPEGQYTYNFERLQAKVHYTDMFQKRVGIKAKVRVRMPEKKPA